MMTIDRKATIIILIVVVQASSYCIDFLIQAFRFILAYVQVQMLIASNFMIKLEHSRLTLHSHVSTILLFFHNTHCPLCLHATVTVFLTHSSVNDFQLRSNRCLMDY